VKITSKQLLALLALGGLLMAVLIGVMALVMAVFVEFQ
jgi:hypothetical protein